ncbi:SDR family oxidoreductase [Arthrobacter sp. N199823]|uniref:SDR family oxidoreductase n=1 Tax=Arthrobacter sp. N199823 TaxID=2058895 RepID=UPI000CE513E8|nr:SDR family oxidoreductase [Arthrobacter sp. N199823]
MAENTSKNAIVTGASSGIGAATVRQLRRNGWNVIAVARREDRLAQLAQETGATPFTVDVTVSEDIERLRTFATETFKTSGGLDTLVNIAGGARGVDSVANGNEDDWDWMYQVNVLGTLKVLKAFLPDLRQHGFGTVLNLTSTAGHTAYEGGAGYNAAKFGQHALTGALRLEEAEHNIRVIEVAPGMVRTDEFTVNRLGGNQEAADAVYQGVDKPLTAEDVAEVVAYAVGLPHHINLDQIVMRPVAQAAAHKVIRR